MAIATARYMEIPDILLRDLRQDLVDRRISDGIGRLEEYRRGLSGLATEQKNAAPLVGNLAQWIDVGFDSPLLLKQVLAGFTADTRGHLTLEDYVQLRLAEGALAMYEEMMDRAIRSFDLVVTLGYEFGDFESIVVAYFWKGRCLRQKGEYEEALTSTLKGKELAEKSNHPRVSAVIRVLESWLLFQKGNSNEALRILQEAEAILRDTDDYVTLGNIKSSYGRMAHREGRYLEAIEYFTAAIEEYRKRNRQHRNVARCLTNMALVKRLITVQLLRKMDRDLVRRQKSVPRGPNKKSPTAPESRRQFEQLRSEAIAHLDEASAIYRHHPHHHGIGSIHLTYGYLYLDGGDLDRAQIEAREAFLRGEQIRDSILMSRSRLLQCMIENCMLEEGVGETVDPGTHARSALAFARDALELASHTQNRGLLASTHIWLGLTHSNSFFENPDLARESYDSATALLKADRFINAWDDLRLLRSKLFLVGNVDSTLRAWSEGSVGNKSFQQLTNEFAELVIPKVWEREGKKISRVVSRLSISPKKVRRILNQVGKRKIPRSRTIRPVDHRQSEKS